MSVLIHLLRQLIDLSPEERAERLAGDGTSPPVPESLRRKVEAILADPVDPDFLETPAGELLYGPAWTLLRLHPEQMN